MATPSFTWTLPPSRSNTSHTSRTKLQTESSAARCRAFRGQKLKLLQDKKVTTIQSQPEFTQASSSMNFMYSAGNPVSPASTSATNRRRPKVQVKRMYGRSSVLYLYYLKRQIRLITSKIDSFSRDLHRQARRLQCKIDSNAGKLRKIILMIEKNHKKNSDVETVLPHFDAKKKLYGEDLKRRMRQLKTIQRRLVVDIRIQSLKLRSKLAPFAHDLYMHMNPLKSKIDSYMDDIEETMKQLNSYYSSCEASVKKELAKFYI